MRPRLGLLLLLVLASGMAREALAETAYGVTVLNALVTFDTASPGSVSSIPITGLQVGEEIPGIDFRPATGQLYALGSTGRLYIIDTTTGAATQVGAGTFALTGTSFGFDFNPVVDRIRVVSDAEQNFRLNPDTGAVAGTDTGLAYAAGDPNAAANPNVVAAAYTNNVAGASSTTLYGIDSTLDILVRIGGIDGLPSPNGGQLTTVGVIGVDASGLVGFDIGSVGTAFAAITATGVTNLYTLNLNTGAATLVGAVGNTPPSLRSFTVGPRLAPSCVFPDVFGVTVLNRLVQFNSRAPGSVFSSIPITGLQGGEEVPGIDFRPSTGQLYALGSTGRLYTINTTTGAATQVGAGTFALAGTSFGFDFNPVVDRIRVVSDADENFRLNPDTGALAGTDTGLAYAAGDPNDAANPNVVAAAYVNNVPGAASTTLYGIDSTLDILVRIGGIDGLPSPNGGQLTTVGAIGVDASGLVGFDVSNSGTAYAAITGAGVTNLYTINLTTGAATLLGSVSNTPPSLRSMAVQSGACGCPPHTIHGHLPGPPTHSGATHEHHGQHGHTVASGCPPHAPGHSAGLMPEEPQLLAAVTAEGAVSDNGPAQYVPGIRLRSVQRGEILQLLITGADPGKETPLVQIGELAAEVLFSGPVPEAAGMWQLLVRVPPEAPKGVSRHLTVLHGGREWPSVDVIID